MAAPAEPRTSGSRVRRDQGRGSSGGSISGWSGGTPGSSPGPVGRGRSGVGIGSGSPLGTTSGSSPGFGTYGSVVMPSGTRPCHTGTEWHVNEEDSEETGGEFQRD